MTGRIPSEKSPDFDRRSFVKLMPAIGAAAYWPYFDTCDISANAVTTPTFAISFTVSNSAANHQGDVAYRRKTLRHRVHGCAGNDGVARRQSAISNGMRPSARSTFHSIPNPRHSFHPRATWQEVRYTKAQDSVQQSRGAELFNRSKISHLQPYPNLPN